MLIGSKRTIVGDVHIHYQITCRKYATQSPFSFAYKCCAILLINPLTPTSSNFAQSNCYSQYLNSDRRSQSVSNGSTAQRDPDSQLISTNLLRCSARNGGGSAWERNWDLDITGIAVSSDSDASKFASLIVVAKVRLACIKSHAVLELSSGIVMLDGDDWPCSESGQFLGDSLDPSLEKTKVAGLAADCGRWHVGGSHIGLVEHECIMSEG